MTKDEKITIGDVVYIKYAYDSTMNGEIGTVVAMKTYGAEVHYLLHLMNKEKGWRIHSFNEEDSFPDVPHDIFTLFRGDSEVTFWWIKADQIEVIQAAKEEEAEDTLYHDAHYNECIVEPIVLMQACMTKEQFKGFLIGNALKYRLRAGHKEDAQQDIDKALRYEKWLKEYEQEGEITI